MNTTAALLTASGVLMAGILSTAPASSSALAGVVAGPSCIAIVMPVVRGVPGNINDAASGLRELMVSYLSGPSTKVVSLEARLPSQAIGEAEQKGCEPLLFISLTRKEGGKGLAKALGQAAGTTAWYLPGGGSVASATARAAAAAGLQTASSLASSTKAKDEVQLEYRLQSAGGQVEFGPKTEHQKATADGEDLLTPVVMRAAEAIVTRKDAK